jgi:hypothetical protein
MNLTPEFTRIAVLRSDGGTSIMAFCTLGRGHILPPGANWVGLGIWRRPASPTNIAEEVGRTDFGSPVVSWQLITDDSLQADRDYRNALVCESGVLKHDISRARERCRELLRGERTNVMPQLDGEFMRVLGQKGPSQELGDIEAERQKWRDAPADPRIDAATTIAELKQIKVG